MRTLVVLLLVVAVLLLAISFATREAPSPEDIAPQQTTTAPAPLQPTTPAAATLPTPPPDAGPDPASSTTALQPIEGLRVRAAEKTGWTELGSTSETSGYMMRVRFTQWGAAIHDITLSSHRQNATTDDGFVVQQSMKIPNSNGDLVPAVYPFAALAVSINNGKPIDLEKIRWENRGPGHYAVMIEDEQGVVVLEIIRRYQLPKGPIGYDLICRQQFNNLSNNPLQVQFHQIGLSDLSNDSDYMGDRRALAAGIYDLDYDPGRVMIRTPKELFVPRQQSSFLFLTPPGMMQHISKGGSSRERLWPGEFKNTKTELIWLAATNRYFAAAVHHPVVIMEASPTTPAPAPSLDLLIDWHEVRMIGTVSNDQDHRSLFYVLRTPPIHIAPGRIAKLDLALFAGPREPELFELSPYKDLGFKNLIHYSLGCFCTFQWLANGLIWLLRLFHNWVFQDWGMAIIALVLVVRLLLHPITKKAQFNMTKMGKAMQALQPEMEKLKKKYQDNQQKLNQETMKLYKEKGVNPANIFGCMPMFLQTPIWIALYAMLFFAIELRHQHAFYGIFQALSGGQWKFLADLSSQDGFIPLGTGFKFPFVGWEINAINLLPLLMGVVFFINQKLTTPPPATEQAAQQQKMMRIVTLLFPIFLYKAPCGLTLYILASTFAGIVDSYIVRNHIKREEEAGTLFQKKPAKSGGFFDKLNKAVEEQKRKGRDPQAKFKKKKR